MVSNGLAPTSTSGQVTGEWIIPRQFGSEKDFEPNLWIRWEVNLLNRRMLSPFTASDFVGAYSSGDLGVNGSTRMTDRLKMF